MIRKVVQGQPAKRRSSPPISTYTVRFRLEVSPDHEIYVLSPGGKGAPPVGFTLERSDRGVIRVDKDKEDGELKSADIEGLARTTSPSWILLPPMSALEWEIETESSRAGVEEATTVYIRESMNRPAAELPSGWYTLAEETHLTTPLLQVNLLFIFPWGKVSAGVYSFVLTCSPVSAQS